jgi:hypothetical protein
MYTVGLQSKHVAMHAFMQGHEGQGGIFRSALLRCMYFVVISVIGYDNCGFSCGNEQRFNNYSELWIKKV